MQTTPPMISMTGFRQRIPAAESASEVMTAGQPKMICTSISDIASCPTMMQLEDRPYVGGVLIHVAEVDQQDVAHSQTGFFDLAWPGDAA
jgi:hypothetical protein